MGRTSAFSTGYKKKRGGSPTPEMPVSRQSGGTSGDLSIPGWKTQTPVVPYSPTAVASAPASTTSTVARTTQKVARAAARQERLVTKYVTKAYTRKLEKKGVPAIEIGTRIEKAKSQLEKDREALLNHPAVQEANAEGKVVGSKGLREVRKAQRQLAAVKGPSGIKSSKAFGLQPRGLHALTPEQTARLAFTNNQGLVADTQAEAAKRRQEAGQPSTIEALSIASLGIPGIGVGGGIVKLSELGARAIPAVASKEAASLTASSLAAKGAARVVAAGESAKSAGQAVKGLPEALRIGVRTAPATSKAAVKALPKAAAQSAKAAPGAIGRGALHGGEKSLKAGSTLALVAGTQNAGLHTAPGAAADAILKGGAASLSPDNFIETAETTGRALPAAVTAPAALLYATGQIPFEGTGPLEQTAKGQFEGMKTIGENLLSGDPEKTQKAFQEEGAFSLLTPVPALSRTKAYKAVRTDARDAAAGARRLAGIGRQAPKGVEQTVFGFAERKAARKRVALSHARTSNPLRVAEAHHTNAVLHGSLKEPALSKAPEGSHVALQTLLEYGIRSPEGVKLVRKRGPKSEPSAEGRVNLNEALSYAEKHPEIFADKNFARALEAGERASKTTPMGMAEMGEVARYRGQGDLFGITPPDRAVPIKARQYTSAKTRVEAWKQLDQMEKRIKTLRSRSRVKGPKGRLEPRRKMELEALDARVKGLRKELDPYTRPDQKSASGERMFWDKEMEREYVARVKAARDKSPLVDPAWTHHATFRSTKLGIEGNSLPGTAGGKVKVRRGALSQNDLVDRSLPAFIRGTVQMPRRRAAGAEFAREFVESERKPFTVGDKAAEIVPDSETWAKITGKKTQENPDGGQFDPKTYARFPVRQWKAAIEDPLSTDATLGALLADAEAGRIASHEPSVIVPRESIREFAEKVNPNPGTVTEFTSKLSRRASKAILATNPSWLVAQIPAEGIPLALAHPELLNPLKTGSILKDLHQWRKENPEKAAMLEGAAGASPQITAGTLRSPLDLDREGSFNPQPAMFAEGAKQMTRGPVGRAMLSTAKLEPLGLFDVKRQNAFRTVLLAAEADKQFRGFTSGVHGYFRKTAKLSESFRGKSRAELWDWLSTTKEGKREMRKLADYVDNIQGNWTAFTRYERAFAPLVIFYPFLRYSLRWTLWTFPKTHPLAATIAYTLGQVNANELEKVLGAKPSSPIGYSWPVVRDGEGNPSVLPGGSRISPGQSAIQQAAATQEAPQLLSALNPVLGAGLTALGGPGPFGQKPSGPAGWAAVDQLLSLPAPLRALMNETDLSSEKVALALTGGKTAPESVISKAFKMLDPDKTKRGLLFPPIPQSAARAKMANRLSAALKTAEENKKSAREAVKYDDSLTVQARAKKREEMKRRSDNAGATIDRILNRLGLEREGVETDERASAVSDLESKPSNLYDGGSIYDKKSIYESGGIYGDKGGSKALQYQPPDASISLPGVDIGGALGAVTNPLASLVLGDTAQASELPKPLQRKTAGTPSREEVINAGRAGTLKLNRKGKLTTPAVRKAAHELRKAEARLEPPKISGVDLPGEGNTFANYLAKYTGLDPQFVGAWVKSEGGGFANGGEAGKNNWLGVGYPGQQTPFSQSPYFNGNAKQAAKATAEWMEGKIGHEYGYRAASGIQQIIPLAAGKGPQAALEALGASGWGTDVSHVAQNMAGVSVSSIPGGGNGARQALKVARRNARAVGLNPTPFNGDVERGQGRTVTVRADAKGMVNWTKSALGTNEGTPKTMRWGAKFGLNPVSQPWCANFVSNGLARRGITNLPSNPNYVPSYEEEWGKYAVPGGLAKAKPGDLITYSGEHIAVYVGGGKAIGGNQGDSVTEGDAVSLSSHPISMVIRPPYRGGKIQIHESTELPGATPAATFGGITPSGEVEAVMASAPAKGQGQRKQRGPTAAQRLKLVNEISSGNLSRFGIPGFTPSVGPSASDLAAIGSSLASGRQELARL